MRGARSQTREIKREAVIRAAASAFQAHGYHNTTIDRIAATLNVSKPTIYYYVANKEQLLFECFVAGLERIQGAIRRSQRTDRPARERLKSEIDQGIRRLLREGLRDGSIAACDPKMTAFALAGALNWIAHWYREDRSMSAAQIAAAFVEVFSAGLRPRGARGRATRPASQKPTGLQRSRGVR